MAVIMRGGQILGKTLTLQSAADATGNGNTMDVRGFNAVGIQITDAGVTSFTVVFEGSIDNTNWIAVLGYNYNDGALNTSVSAAGLYGVNINGLAYFRARISAIVNNAQSITVTGHAETESAGNYRDVQLAASEVTVGGVEIVTENDDAVADDTLDALRVFEVTGETVYNATGALAIALATTEAGKFQLVRVSIHFSAAPTTSEDITVTHNTNDGAAYDVVLRRVDPSLSSLTDFVYRPEEDDIYESGDQINLAFANTDTVTYGALIVVRRIT